jgi:hypothetical protein
MTALLIIYLAVPVYLGWRLGVERVRRENAEALAEAWRSAALDERARAVDSENELDVWRSWSGRKGADSDRSLS